MRLFGRRRVIASLVVAVLALHARAAWSAGDPATRLVLRILAARGGYVRLGDDDRARFAADYLAERKWMVKEVLRSTSFLRVYDTPLFPFLASAAHLERMRALERDVITAFLLGTGFFEGGEALAFRGLRNGGCRNPFARFD